MVAVQRAVDLDPLNARAFRAKGAVAYAARRYVEALAPLAQALQLNPKMTYAHALRGYVLLGLNRAADAEKSSNSNPKPNSISPVSPLAMPSWADQQEAQKAFAASSPRWVIVLFISRPKCSPNGAGPTTRFGNSIGLARLATPASSM